VCWFVCIVRRYVVYDPNASTGTGAPHILCIPPLNNTLLRCLHSGSERHPTPSPHFFFSSSLSSNAPSASRVEVSSSVLLPVSGAGELVRTLPFNNTLLRFPLFWKQAPFCTVSPLFFFGASLTCVRPPSLFRRSTLHPSIALHEHEC
jgi:hypothetical protein